MNNSNRPIKSFSEQELVELFSNIKLPKYRVQQVMSWLYEKGAHSYDEMSNLPKALREQLEASFPLYSPSVVKKMESSDGSRKYLLEFHDEARVEAVGIPSENGRLTVCVSTQSGCSMGCIFCATGKAGFTRSLYPGEIVDQVLAVQDDFSERITNVVLMGQGEPFANYDHVLAALRILNHPKFLAIGARHITVSTCGVISGIKRYSEEPEQFTLAVSLHSAIQETRNRLIPSMEKQRLDTLKVALKRYNEITGRRFTFEYALMKNINDSDEELEALIAYCKGLLCHVNLIPLNKVKDSVVEPSSASTVHYWNNKLETAGVNSSIRRSKGNDIAAACGQLSAQVKSEER